MQRSILYSDIVTAAGKVAAIMVKDQNQTYSINTNGGSTAAVRQITGREYEIALPSIRAEARLSRTEADFILGLLVHELGHVRYTSFKFPPDNTRELHDLANALEDCREERAIMTSGNPTNGAALLAQVTETMALRAAAKGGASYWPRYTPGQATACAVVTLGRLANPQYGALPAATAYSASIPADVATLVNRFMSQITSTKSTAECFELARKMLAEAGKVLPPPVEPEKAKDEGKDTEGGSGEAEAGKGEGEAPTAEDEGNEGTPTAGEGEGEGEGEDGGEGAPVGPEAKGESKGGQSHGADPVKPETFNPAEALEEMLGPRVNPASKADKIAATFAATIAKLDSTRHESDTQQARAYGARPSIATDHRAAVKTAGISPKVRQLLHSQDDAMTTRYETRGRLDRRAISRTCTGDPRVFTRRSMTDGIKTGVGFLLDMSGSMVGGKDVAQAQSAIALGDACERAGADVAVWGFGPSPSYSKPQDIRIWGGVLLPLKNWNEKMELGAALIAGSQHPHGTNLCPAIIAAARELAARPGLDKRILMVMTDGDCRFGRAATRATAEYAAARYGVDIIGVGILCDVSEAFPKGKSVTVQKVSTLATATMAALLKAVS